MAAIFRTLPGTVPGPYWGFGKSSGVIDFNGDGVLETVLFQSIVRGDDPFQTEYTGSDPPLLPVIILHFDKTAGLSSYSLPSSTSQPLVSGWNMDLTIRDFNGDGRADMLWSDTGPEIYIRGAYPLSNVRLALSTPAGPAVSVASTSYPNQGFAASQPGSGLGFWHSHGAADLDADGDIDVLAVNLQGGPDYINLAPLLNDGRGVFTYTPNFVPTAAQFGGPANPGLAPSTVVLADLNGDNRAEFVWGALQSFPGAPSPRENRIYWNSTTGFDVTKYISLPFPAAGFGTHDIANISTDRMRTADLNRDGLDDFLFMYADLAIDGGRWGQVWLQNADHTFRELPIWPNNVLPQLVSFSQGYALEPIDINNDGLLDIEFTHSFMPQLGDVAKVVWINMGDETFQALDSLAPNLLPNLDFISDWRFLDMDADGQVELWTDQSTGFHVTRMAVHALQPSQLQAVAGQTVTGTIFADTITGSAGADVIFSGLGSDIVNTGSGDDRIDGGVGNDVIEGGAGVDTGEYAAAASSYSRVKNVDGSWTVRDLRTGGGEGVDRLVGVEFARFSDKLIALESGYAISASLEAAITNITRAGPVSAANSGLIATLAASGASTDAQAIARLVSAADTTTSVATLAYQFFTGHIPGGPGYDYLVSPTGPNANNLNAAYYQSFNLENRYINFAVNLGKLGEGKDAFAAGYGSMSLFDATKAVYTRIFGGTPTDAKVHALLDPTFSFNGQTITRADYFALYGQDGVNGIGTKAAMVGWLMAEAEKADIGMYANANAAFLTDLADGATFAVDLIGVYGRPEYAFGG